MTLNDILANRNYLNAPSLSSNTAQAGSLPQKLDFVSSLGNTPSKNITTTKTTSTGGGGGGGGNNTAVNTGGNNNQSQPQQPQQPSYEDIMRNQINDGYNNYFGYLDQIFGSLPGQADNQNQVITNTTNQNVSDLQSATDQSKADLATEGRKVDENQTKNLRDLADNIINQTLAGNVYLGAKGAGDSSAANMYSYALTKLGSKQRGDVVAQSDSIRNDIADRSAKVNNVYTQELSRINTDKSNKLLEVAQWLSDAQNQIKQAKANGELDKSKDLQSLSSQLLSIATQRAQQIYNDSSARQSQLETWAMNNSQNVNQLKTNLSQISSINPSLPQASNLVGTPTVDGAGNISANSVYGGGGSSTTEKKRDIYGNIIA